LLHFIFRLSFFRRKSDPGIDLRGCNELVKEKDLKGMLVEIENPNEKLVISID